MEKNEKTLLKEKRLFLFDIDGTVAIDADFIDGSLALFRYINSIGGKYRFITNNSTKSIVDYIDKFAKMGLQTDADSFVTASLVTALYLQAHYGGQKVFVLGTRSFQAELRRYGVDVTTDAEGGAVCAVVGYDSELTYEKVAALCRLLQTCEVDYLATNPDLGCPVSFGMVPDCGAICKLIGCAVGLEPLFLGKPGPAMVQLCLERTGFSKTQTLVVGDRLYTDIACGIQSSVDTALVFTGEAKPEDLMDTPYHPTWCFSTVRELLEKLLP